MEYVGVCRLCGDKVAFSHDNIYSLGHHLITKHPEIQMTHFVLEDSGDGLQGKKRKSQSVQDSLSHKSSSKLLTMGKFSTLLKGAKQNVYKTTVETWRPGAAPVTCPKCGNHDQPYIKKLRHKVAYNSIGAFFLLGCWPLCFLPLVMCGTTTSSICCRKCGHCLGNYDSKSGKLIPEENGEAPQNDQNGGRMCNC